MKAPDFWWRPPGLAARLLQPISAVYGTLAARRMALPGARASLPVICIGNVTVGGSGKTPTAIEVARLLRGMGREPAFLTRGYGGALRGPILVDPARHGFEEVGDEPLLLARHAPTVIARARPAGAVLAASTGADVIVMDDGLQNPSLQKDLTIAVFDGGAGMGNRLVFPAGPLRAPPSAHWPRIGAVLIVGEGEPGRAIAAEAGASGLPVLHARLEPEPEQAVRLEGRRVLAFAGIGRPEKFFATLRAVGAEVVETRPLPDHHVYNEREVLDLLADAERGGLVPVTTEKDLVRLVGFRSSDARAGAIVALPVKLACADTERLEALLASALGRA